MVHISLIILVVKKFEGNYFKYKMLGKRKRVGVEKSANDLKKFQKTIHSSQGNSSSQFSETERSTKKESVTRIHSTPSLDP